MYVQNSIKYYLIESDITYDSDKDGKKEFVPLTKIELANI